MARSFRLCSITLCRSRSTRVDIAKISMTRTRMNVFNRCDSIEACSVNYCSRLQLSILLKAIGTCCESAKRRRINRKFGPMLAKVNSATKFHWRSHLFICFIVLLNFCFLFNYLFVLDCLFVVRRRCKVLRWKTSVFLEKDTCLSRSTLEGDLDFVSKLI